MSRKDESTRVSGLLYQICQDEKLLVILTTVVRFSYSKIIHRCRKLGKRYGLKLGQLRDTGAMQRSCVLWAAGESHWRERLQYVI